MRNFLHRCAPYAVLMAGWLSLTASHVWYVCKYRVGYPVDIDEAGYLNFSFQYWDALQAGGLSALWDQLQVPSAYAPLVPTLAVPIHAAVGKGIFTSFAVQYLFLAFLAAGAFLMTRSVAGRWWATLAGLGACAVPLTMIYARTFQYVTAASGTSSLALGLIAFSDGCRRTWVMVGAGIAIGLMLLSRTMMIAFAPGLVLAAIVAVLVAGITRRRILNVALMTVVAAAIAFIWYWRSFDPIWGYLTGYGYGDQSHAYGAKHEPTSLTYWIRTPHRVISNLYVPLAAIVLIGVIAKFAELVLRRAEWRSWRSAPGVPAVAATITFAVSAWAVLTSSRNDGTGFVAPLLTPVLVLGIVAAATLPWRRVRLGIGLMAVVAVAVTAGGKTGMSDSLAQERFLGETRFGQIPITYGLEPRVVAPALASERRMDGEWLDANDEIARRIHDHAEDRGFVPVITNTAGSPFLNYNTLLVAWNLRYDERVIEGQVDPRKDSYEYDVEYLKDPIFGSPNTAIIVERGEVDKLCGQQACRHLYLGSIDYPPLIDAAALRRAAIDEGFTVFNELELPDGRLVELMWIDRGPSAQKAAS